ncbi:mog1 protein, putative [Eimeria tenella]|uniref:Mog1 protein, putative n=1 Tax=Eimeria tenella TaxID=5802 RepID=U6L1F7_EIMTE|nr:mog1 protein, putative [Eimeria tenella]CDJ43028.1 mog1 protein, putative [Eimeria tenella]|eukprot:XP_013233778.1 mog1 protein, putative [Eimeria tenella]
MSVPGGDGGWIRSLFGGAMTCDIPKYLDDMSKIMIVPDQQEAFVNDDGSISVIIEILEHQPVPDTQAAEFFFNDLMAENSSLSSRIVDTSIVPKEQPPMQGHTLAFLKGEFQVQKKRAARPDHVLVRLAIVRIPEHRADIVISMNERLAETADGHGNHAEIGAAGSLDDAFLRIVESFRIVNYGLFT